MTPLNKQLGGTDAMQGPVLPSVFLFIYLICDLIGAVTLTL